MSQTYQLFEVYYKKNFRKTLPQILAFITYFYEHIKAKSKRTLGRCEFLVLD